jgi:hypothetical protein
MTIAAKFSGGPSLVKIPMQLGLETGLGVEPLTGTPLAPAATGIVLVDTNTFKENRRAKVVSSSDDYKQMIEASAYADVSSVGWSASADVNYFRQSTVGETSLAFILSSKVETKVSQLDNNQITNVKLTKEAKEWLTKDPAKFLEIFGTHFIAGFVYGGYFMGNVVIHTETKEQVASLKASMSASINAFTASATVGSSIQQDLSNYKANYSMEAEAVIDGVPEQFEIGALDSMDQTLARFANDLKTNGGGNQVLAICYKWEMLPDVQDVLFQAGITALPTVRSDVGEGLTDEAKKLDFLQASVNSLIAGKGYIGQSQLDMLKTAQAQLQAANSKIESLSVPELLSLNADMLKDYRLADTIQAQIAPIVQGACTIIWTFNLDSTFQPNGSETGTIENIKPSSEYVFFRNPQKNWGTWIEPWDIGYHYYYFDANGHTNPNGKLKLRSIFLEHPHNSNVNDHSGPWIEPNLGQESKAVWQGAEFNNLTVKFKED